MKGLTVALAIILVLAVLVTTNALILCQRLDDLLAEIESIELDAVGFENAYRGFESMRGLIILTVRDDIRLSIVNAFSDCISYAAEGDKNELEAAKGRLVHMITEVRRLSTLSFDAIF